MLVIGAQPGRAAAPSLQGWPRRVCDLVRPAIPGVVSPDSGLGNGTQVAIPWSFKGSPESPRSDFWETITNLRQMNGLFSSRFRLAWNCCGAPNRSPSRTTRSALFHPRAFRTPKQVHPSPGKSGRVDRLLIVTLAVQVNEVWSWAGTAQNQP